MRPKVYLLRGMKNWGDIFTPFLFERFGIEAEFLNETGILENESRFWHQAEVFCCGSLIERIPDNFSGHVLGSGNGYVSTTTDLSNVKAPLLLRGPLTAKRCAYTQPERLGDPGILASLFVTPNLAKSHRYGIVPHYVDKDNADVAQWITRGALNIDIESGILPVINAIASCEMIVSSSLHGLVIADSLGVPCRPVKLSDKVFGRGFKIQDYYATYGEVVTPAFTIEEGFAVCRTRDVSAVRKDVFDVFKEYAELLK